MSRDLLSALGTLAWGACVIATYAVAKDRSHYRLVWTLFAPVITLLVVVLLPLRGPDRVMA